MIDVCIDIACGYDDGDESEGQSGYSVHRCSPLSRQYLRDWPGSLPPMEGIPQKGYQ